MKIVTLILLFSISSWAGNDVENGGDAIAFEFSTSARLAVENLKMSKLSPELKNLLQQISKSLESTKVYSKPHMFLGKNEVDAINYPLKKQILVSRSRWNIVKLVSVETRMGFVLHEYLGVSNIDDGDYSKSGKLVEAISPDSFRTLLAQESFLKAVGDLGSYFWNFHVDAFPDRGHKEVCIIAGEVNVRVQGITQTVAEQPSWFRSDAIKKYSVDLTTIATEIESQCLNDEINYRLLGDSYNRGHDLLDYFERLMFSR